MTFTTQPVAILGDLIIDRYIHGKSDRLSPEAPVPIVHIDSHSERYNLGGAGNVAANIRALGGNPILMSITGASRLSGIVIERLLDDADIDGSYIGYDAGRTVTTKVRIIANNQQIVRLDEEKIEPIDSYFENRIIDRFRAMAPDLEAVILSDYGKGVLAGSLIAHVTGIAAEYNIPVFLDPKVANAVHYRVETITAMTPNLTEAIGLNNGNNGNIEDIGYGILSKYWHQYVLITRGEQGMSLFTANRPAIGVHPAQDRNAVHIPTTARNVFDVSGAGDTVIATLALAFASGYSMLESVQLANKAAGIVVGKAGTVPVSKEELETE